MSRSLTVTKIQEDLQAVVHDLLDLSAMNGLPFMGVVFDSLDVAYRDYGVAAWRITIEPASTPLAAAPLTKPDDIDPGPDQEG